MTAPMAAPEPAATRRELDSLITRVDSIDEHGTRGIIGIAVQVSEINKDIGKLGEWNREHESFHQADARARVNARRWALGFAVSVLVALLAVVGLLIQLSGRVH